MTASLMYHQETHQTNQMAPWDSLDVPIDPSDPPENPLNPLGLLNMPVGALPLDPIGSLAPEAPVTCPTEPPCPWTAKTRNVALGIADFCTFYPGSSPISVGPFLPVYSYLLVAG